MFDNLDTESSTEFSKLFDDTQNVEIENNEPNEDEHGETSDEENVEGGKTETDEDSSEEESNTDDEETVEEDTKSSEKEDEEPNIIATIEVDGKEFKLDEGAVQSIAEQYVKVARTNKMLLEDRNQVVDALKHIENVRNGVDIDESMQALGVNFDALIHDKVKDFIRRSTMSAKERELEDANREREKLRKQIQEREEREASEKEAAAGKEQADLIIQSVNSALTKIPERFQKEIQIEVFGAIERRLRQGGNKPSSKAIQNAVNTIYNRKYKTIYGGKKDSVKSQSIKPPKPVRNNPTDSTTEKKSSYNATDYNEIFR